MNVNVILGYVSAATIPVAPAAFFGGRVYHEASQMFPVWLALVTAACAAIGLELLGFYAGHNMVEFWHGNQRTLAALSGVILLAYVAFGLYELWGTVGATLFMIAPLAYTAVGLGGVARDEHKVQEDERKFTRDLRLRRLEAQERLKLAEIEHSASTVPAQSEPEPAQSQHECGGCGRSFGTSQALNAHKRFCTAETG